MHNRYNKMDGTQLKVASINQPYIDQTRIKITSIYSIYIYIYIYIIIK